MPSNNNKKSFWFDSHHRGALRCICGLDLWGTDIGRDGRSRLWQARIVTKSKTRLLIDFTTKTPPRGRMRLEAVYGPGRNTLHWSDGNVWRRVRSDPSKLFIK